MQNLEKSTLPVRAYPEMIPCSSLRHWGLLKCKSDLLEAHNNVMSFTFAYRQRILIEEQRIRANLTTNFATIKNCKWNCTSPRQKYTYFCCNLLSSSQFIVPYSMSSLIRNVCHRTCERRLKMINTFDYRLTWGPLLRRHVRAIIHWLSLICRGFADWRPFFRIILLRKILEFHC
jgi:hypothetical protein